jgi:thioredoxin-like negative regulator of GroEL
MRKGAIILAGMLAVATLWGADPAVKQVLPRLTFIEFGSDMCVSCRGMRAVTEEVAKKYQGVVTVVFSDVTVSDSLATSYNVEQIPTQLYLDVDGNEISRHTDMATAEDINKVIDGYLESHPVTGK